MLELRQEEEFFLLSQITLGLRRDPTLLPNIDRDTFDQKYKTFVDGFRSFCEEKYGAAGFRFINAHVNFLTEATEGNGVIDQQSFESLEKHIGWFRFNHQVEERNIQNLRNDDTRGVMGSLSKIDDLEAARTAREASENKDADEVNSVNLDSVRISYPEEKEEKAKSSFSISGHQGYRVLGQNKDKEIGS